MINEASHWLEDYPGALKQFKLAEEKFNADIFTRNLLDDLRLSLELLIKEVLENEKSLENQKAELGRFLSSKECTKEVGNMFITLIDYFCKFQNNHVKHRDSEIQEEIEFIFELTASFVKHIIRLNKKR